LNELLLPGDEKNSRKEKKKNFSDFCVLQELFKLELRGKNQREKKKKKW